MARALIRKFKPWLPAMLAVVVAIALGALVYAAVQQNYRQSANDPQIQLVQDGAASLARGVAPQQITGTSLRVDIARSLAPFVIIFDDHRNIVVAGGQLDGQTPVPPAGSFDFAKSHGQDRFTWEPKPGVRQAAILEYNSGSHPGYVLASRNLLEVEKRENQLTVMVAVLLAITLLAILVLTFILC